MGISRYYDWGRTFAYDAPMTMVVGVRDVGKTYGLRKQLVNDFLKDGARFVQLVRYKTELPIMSGEYLAKVGREFPGHMFKTDNRFAWCAERVPDGEKPDWRCMGYFCALTQMQQMKNTTFVDPYRIVLDEAIIDPALQRYTSYLPREYYVLTQAVDSITREQVDEDGSAVPRNHQPRVYLLANGLSMANPYFHLLGIRKPPTFGKHWYMDSDGRKTVLLDYVEPRRPGQAAPSPPPSPAGCRPWIRRARERSITSFWTPRVCSWPRSPAGPSPRSPSRTRGGATGYGRIAARGWCT